MFIISKTQMRKEQMIFKLQMLDLRSSENKTDFQAGFLGTKVLQRCKSRWG
ncbi:hypothetical protein Hanom_Chr03g00270491 [Helianthus anomalus]